jgi:uncharacterized protein (DUF305 family)
MQLSARFIAAIAGLSAMAAGAIAVSSISFPSSADPLQQAGQPNWQMPAKLGQRPMHRGGSSGQGPIHRGQQRGHHQHMSQMMQANSEFEFLSLMIPHHEEAVATAQRVLEHSNRPEMREFARNIIDVQTAEIEQMEVWLGEWYPGQDTDLTYSPMMRDLSELEGDALDRAFLEDMIMHHMGAVMMSQRLVNHGLVEHQNLRPFARNIASTQRQEIGQMRRWLQNWYSASGRMATPGS